MQLDLKALRTLLEKAPQEETVDSSDVNPYLLQKVLFPLLAGTDLRYGDIDYSQFEADDLRELAHYCDERGSMRHRLADLKCRLVDAAACACKHRAFC